MLGHFERLLVVAPHPDDEAIGCGGTIHRVTRDGGEALVLFGNITDAVRLSEAIASCDVLGAQMASIEAKPTWTLNDADPMWLVAQVEAHIQEWRPTAVLLPHPDGFHFEHRLLAEATLAATRPNGGTGKWRPPVVAVYEEPFDSWVLTSTQTQFSPSLYVGLEEEDLIAKCRAMESHASQVRPSPSERSTMALGAMAGLRGAQSGVEYAEAFEVRRWMA